MWGIPQLAAVLVSLTESAGCVLADTEQRCYRTIDLTKEMAVEASSSWLPHYVV